MLWVSVGLLPVPVVSYDAMSPMALGTTPLVHPLAPVVLQLPVTPGAQVPTV
jgi:hypothetical protein